MPEYGPEYRQGQADNWWDWLWGGVRGRVEEAWHRPLEEPAVEEEPETFTEAWQRVSEDVQAEEGLGRIGAALGGAAGLLAQGAGRLVEGVVEPVVRGTGVLGQSLSAGFQAIQEPANVLEQLTGAAAIALRGEADTETVQEWAPLTERTWSLAWQQAQERLGIRDPEELQPGQMTTEAWGRDVLGRALDDVKSGRRTASQIVQEEQLPIAEFLGAFAADPLNVIDAINPSNVRRINAAIESSEVAYATRAAELAQQASDLGEGSRVRRVVDRVFGGPEGAQRLNPLAATATAKVDQDLAGVYLFVTGLTHDVGNGGEAVRRLRDWIADPAAAADVYGAALASERGLQAAEVLKGLDLNTLATGIPGRRFNARAFASEVGLYAREVLEETHGLVDPQGYAKFARAFKGFSSEFYLTLKPGYWFRNAVDNAGTLAYDGILALDTPAHIDEYLDAIGAISLRASELGAIRESKLPSVLGRASNMARTFLAKAHIGEDAFFRRGYVGAHRRTWGKLWQSGANVPNVPDSLTHLERELLSAARSSRSSKALADEIETMLRATTPGEGLRDIVGYLDDDALQALSPAMLDDLRMQITSATSMDEVEGILARAQESILAHGDEALVGTVIDPAEVRSVWTDTEIEEMRASLATSLMEDARRFGLDEDQAVASIAASFRRWEELDLQLQQAVSSNMRQAAELTSNDALQVVYRANRRSQRILEETRRVVDAAREEAWAKASAVKGVSAVRRAELDVIWGDYFALASRQWDAAYAARMAEMENAWADLQRVAAGESFRSISGLDARAMMEERVDYAARRARDARVALDEAADFDQRLDILRARVDIARERAWGAANGLPDQRTLDLLDSADRMEQIIARKWRAEREYLRQSMLKRREAALAALEQAREISKTLQHDTNVELFNVELWFRAAQDALAKERFRELAQVWDMTAMRIRGTPAQSRLERLLALDLQHTHGLAPDEAMRLASERVGVGAFPEGELAERSLARVRAEAQEIAGTVEAESRVYTRAQFRQDLRTEFRLAESEAVGVEAVMEARAQSWAARTGRDASEYYGERIARITSGTERPEWIAPDFVARSKVEFLEDGRAVIRALDQPNVSSVVHELGHVFRRDLDAADLAVAEDWAGVRNGIWTVEAEERWARGFERFLAEGSAPHPSLYNVFTQFKDWLTRIYRNVVGSRIDIDLSDDVRDVMNRLLRESEVPEWQRAYVRSATPIGEMPIRRPSDPTELWQLDEEQWWINQNVDTFGKVNGRLTRELNRLELWFNVGAVKSRPLPQAGTVRRGIRAHDLGEFIVDAIKQGVTRPLLDPSVDIMDLARERGLLDDLSTKAAQARLKDFTSDIESLRAARQAMADPTNPIWGKDLLITNNSKAGMSLDFGLATCHPTVPCQECYAADFMYKGVIGKVMRNTILLFEDPVGFGRRAAHEINMHSKTELPFMRMLGSGDLTSDEMIEAFNIIAQNIDRPIHIFSRHHHNLAKLKGTEVAPWIKMGSIDADLYRQYGRRYLLENLEKRGINNAFLYTDESELAILEELYRDDALGLVFPTKKSLWDNLPEELKVSSCPCDAAERNAVSSCLQCALSQMGCYMVYADKFVDSNGNVIKATALETKARPLLSFLLEERQAYTTLRREGKLPEVAPSPTAAALQEGFHKLLGKSITDINKSKNSYIKGKQDYILLKDVRWPGDKIHLIDRQRRLQALQAKDPTVTMADLVSTSTERYLEPADVLSEANGFIGNFKALQQRAKLEGRMYFPGGEIQPDVGYARYGERLSGRELAELGEQQKTEWLLTGEEAPAAQYPVPRNVKYGVPEGLYQLQEGTPGLPAAGDVGAQAGAGGVRNPRTEELLAIVEPQAQRALDQIRDGLRRDWDTWSARQVDEETIRQARGWVEEQVAPAMRDAEIASAAAAETVTNFALHNYKATTKLDDALSLVYPYHFWYSRAGKNWAKRLASNPSRLANYLRYRTMMQRINEERGLRKRFEGKWKLPIPNGLREALGLEWMSPAAYFDPVQWMFPYATFDRADFASEEETNSWLERAYRTMQMYAPQPYAFLQVPMQLAEVGGLEERESFMDIWPQTAPIRAVTAAIGLGGPEGIDIEKPIRKALGLPGQEQWQPYRVRRMLASMAADEPSTTMVALRAQELQDRVEEQLLPLEVAVGDREPAGDELYNIAQEFNWTTAELAAAMDMLREATVRSAAELGIRKATAYLTGTGMTVMAEGEERQMELQREGLSKLWSPENQQGSYEAYRQWKDSHPEVLPRQKQYRALPDIAAGIVEIEERQGLGPGSHANYLRQREAKDRIHAKYDRMADEHLASNPGDWDGYRDIEDERRREIAVVEEQWPLPDAQETEKMAGDEMPQGWQGQSPAEFADYVAEQVAWHVRDSEPKPEMYTAGDEIDWDGYYAALEEWQAQIPETLPQLDAVRGLGGQYSDMTLTEILTAIRQRYDSPLEAVARIYHDMLGEQWDRYWQAREEGRQVYDETVGAFLATRMPATALIGEVLERYKAKGWTAEQLRGVYANVVFGAAAAGAGDAEGIQDLEGGAAPGKSGTTDEEIAQRVATEGWQAVYGTPWYARRRSGGGGGRGGRGGGGRPWSPYVPPRWEQPAKEYGGPRWRRI